MYVTTFYSFKGGVGRSMALANAAVELARRGRRVLAVDFDLEAPGLDTFDILRPPEQVPGIIDFVHDYLTTNQAPEASNYLCKLPASDDLDGELWIMPSGAQHAAYAAQFNDIDWAELYEKHDGYLLFEDLKAQWKRAVEPDYVLIDSRTGHTDTGGICTRQLPDAVAILFFPNEQNLRGLTRVVGDIRAESTEGRRDEIDLHFVMSNVPDLDDEDHILKAQLDAFRQQLGFREPPLVVHRYDSLSLLNQVVFTEDRPRSRLAREYKRLVRRIVGHNLEDRDGALDYVRQAGERWRRRGGALESPEKTDAKLERIERAHAEDGDVLFALVHFFENDGEQERSLALLDRAIEAGCEDPEAYLKRARARAETLPDGATKDAFHVLQFKGLPPPLVREAVRLVADDRLGDIAKSAAVTSMDSLGRVWLADMLAGSLNEMKVAVDILESLVGDDGFKPKVQSNIRNILALRQVGLGDFAAAIKLLGDGRDVKDMEIGEAFNYGMALWGATGSICVEPFARVVELQAKSTEGEERDTANYLQCLAVAHLTLGDQSAAATDAKRSRKALEERTERHLFSCWRYRHVSRKEFERDLDDIEALIRGEDRKPHFMNPRATSGGE